MLNLRIRGIWILQKQFNGIVVWAKFESKLGYWLPNTKHWLGSADVGNNKKHIGSLWQRIREITFSVFFRLLAQLLEITCSRVWFTVPSIVPWLFYATPHYIRSLIFATTAASNAAAVWIRRTRCNARTVQLFLVYRCHRNVAKVLLPVTRARYVEQV